MILFIHMPRANEPKIDRLVPALLDWFARHARDLPWRLTRDPYAIWVSEIMLQQTQVKTVLPYWRRWIRELPTIAALARAKPEKIHKLWEGLGYYTRVRNLQKAAQRIVEDHGGRFPETFDDILALPGIGRYTAGAICSIAFNQPTPILDGNVIRVLTRIFGMRGNPRDKRTNAMLWRLAEELVVRASQFTYHDPLTESLVPRTFRPARLAPDPSHLTPDPSHLTPDPSHLTPFSSQLNQSLMELGALVCTPRLPRCDDCPVASHCIARRENRTGQLPNFGPRAPSTSRQFLAFVVRNRDRLLVRQRPAGVVNAHLWELPNAEVTGVKPDWRKAARRALGCIPAAAIPLCTVKHSITRYRMSVDVYAVNGRPPAARGRAEDRWPTTVQLRRLAFTAAHRKILDRLVTIPPKK